MITGTLIDTIRVVASATGNDGELVAPQTDLLFGATSVGGLGAGRAALTGVDGFEYHWRGKIAAVQNSPVFTLRPNEVATDQFGLGIDGQASATSFPEQTLHLMGGGLTQPLTGSFECSFDPEDAAFSVFRSMAGLREDGTSVVAADYRARLFGSVWEDIAATFDRAAIHSSVAGAFGAGTYVRLYRIKGRL